MRDLALRYHHMGIPTRDPREREASLSEFGVHVSGYEESPFGIEWMRYEGGSPLPELVKTVPHVAFQVEDLEAALAGREILIPPNSPSPGVRVAFIVHNGAPVEFLEIAPGHPDRLPEPAGEEKRLPVTVGEVEYP